MPIQYINTGSGPNAGDGDSVRAAFNKVNSTFAYLSTVTNSGGSGVITTSSFTSTLAYYISPQTLAPIPRIEYNNGTLSIGNKSVTTGSFNTLVIENGFYNNGFACGFLFAQSHNTFDANNFQFYRSRGSSRAPTAVQQGDEIVDIHFMGHDGTTSTVGFIITPVVDQTVRTGIVPIRLRFTGNNGTTSTITTHAEISSSGTFSVNRLSSLSTQTATITSDDIILVSNIIPNSGPGINLGSTSNQWANIYTSGTIYLNNIPLTVATTTGNLLVNGLPVVGGVGSPVTLIGSTSTSAGLPVSGTYGQAYIVTTTNQVWFWSTLTTSWQNAGPISGPQGLRGLPGIDGANGLNSTSTISNGTWTFSITTSGSIVYPNGSIQATATPTITTGTGLIAVYGTSTVTLSLNTATLMTNAVNATTASYATSFNTGTLVANAVNATTASYATSFNTGTLVANAVTATYATSFNTGTLVANAVNATTSTNAGYAYSFNTGTLVANAVNATTAAALVSGTWTMTVSSTGSVRLPHGVIIKDSTNLAIAIGVDAGNTQDYDAIAIGTHAGGQQASSAIAIGWGSGQYSQGIQAIAIGDTAGNRGQGLNSIAIGTNAGENTQTQTAIAIGTEAGRYSQGENAIAIGHLAGTNNQHLNTIILNASGSVLNSTATNGLYIAPIRSDGANTATSIYYNATTKEVTYGPAATSGSTFNTSTLVSTAVTLANTSTAFVGYAVTATQLTNLRIVSAPTSLLGTSTNKLGDIAVDSNYFYYCSGTYYPAVTTLNSYGQNDFTNPTATIIFAKNPSGPTPQAGWTLYASFSTWTIITVTDQGTTWSIVVSGLGSGTYNISTGTAFTMTNPSPGAIWYQTPWNAVTNTGTVAYASAINTVTVPASSTSTGVKGQIAVNSTSMYVCVATNSWLRFAGATF